MEGNVKNMANLNLSSQPDLGAEQFRSYLGKMKRYKQIFAKYDIDHDKKLSIDEFKKIFLDNNEPVDGAGPLFKEFDYDKSNSLTWNEFVDAMDKLEMIRLIPDYKDEPTPRTKQKFDDDEKEQKKKQYNEVINRFASQFRALHSATKQQGQNLSKEEIEKLQLQPLTRQDLLEALTHDKQNYKSMEEAAEAVSKLMDMIDTDRSDTISFFEFRTFLEKHLNNPKADIIQILTEQSKQPKKKDHEKKTSLTGIAEEKSPTSSSQTKTLEIVSTNSDDKNYTLNRRQTMEMNQDQPHHYVAHAVNIQDQPFHPNVSNQTPVDDNNDPNSKLPPLPNIVPYLTASNTNPSTEQKRISQTQQGMMQYMESMKKVYSLFNNLDKDKNRRLSVNEIKELFPNEADARDWFNFFDQDKSGELTWDEFRVAIDKQTSMLKKDQKAKDEKQAMSREERMKKYNEDIQRFSTIFRKLKGNDPKDNTPITREQLLHLIKADTTRIHSLEEAATAVANIMREADTDRSGDISWSEFLEYMKNHQELVFS